MSRYVIVGAGAIGGLVAGRLAQHSETPPPLVARGANAEAIRSRGLLLRDPDEAAHIPVPIVTRPVDAHLTTDDVLVFATKTHQLQTALLEWVDRPVYGPDGKLAGTAGELLPVLTALNGVESERLALRLFRRVYGVCVWVPAVHLEPGEFLVSIAPLSGMFIIGRYGRLAGSGPVGEGGDTVGEGGDTVGGLDDTGGDRALLESVRADWEAARFGIHVVDDVMPWKYRKLLGNLENAVQALLGGGRGEDMYAADRQVVEALRAEALTVYDAAGITIPTADDEAALRSDAFQFRPVPGADFEMGGSSWQSLARGTGSIETDYLNGEIALRGREVGVATPVNEALQRLARRAATERLAPGWITADELRRVALG